MSDMPKHVLSSDGKLKGRVTGGTRVCGMEGCRGHRIGVRWEDGKLTWPCSKGMVTTAEPTTWMILH